MGYILMGTAVGKNDFETGLTLEYDAANSKSYSGSGASITDISGNANSGTLTGGYGYNYGYSGTFTFDGSSGYINTSYTLSNVCSVSFWFYNNLTYNANNRGLFSTYASASFNGMYIGTTTAISNGLRFWYNSNSYTNLNYSFLVNTWYNITVTSSGSQILIYVNGVLANTISGATTHADVLNIGRTRFDTNYWSGYIANFQVYNRVLGQAEVSQIFDSQKGTFIAAPFTRRDLFWYVDAGNPSSYPGTGTSWYDLSGNGYIGTLTNGPTYSSANNGYIQFDGSNDYSSMGLSNATYTQLTFCGWFYMTSYGSYAPMIQNRGSSGSTTGMSVSPSATQLGYHWNDDGGTWGYNSGLSILQNTWAFYAVSVSPTTAIFFVNGSFVTRSYSHSSTTFGAGCFISADVNGGRYTASRVGKAWVYSRALDYSEILQNYNAYRGLYGL
jgi:hypothetical protein